MALTRLCPFCLEPLAECVCDVDEPSLRPAPHASGGTGHIEDLPGGSDPQVEAGMTRFRSAEAGMAGAVAPDEQSADGPAR